MSGMHVDAVKRVEHGLYGLGTFTLHPFHVNIIALAHLV